MSWSLQEKGSGSRRDVVVIAHGGVTDPIRAAAPGAIVVSLVAKPLSGGYGSIGPGKVPPLFELVNGALQAAGGPSLGRLILVGFSEGCQAVRAWLAAGEVPSAAIAIDGIHGSSPAPSSSQVIPWRSFFERARRGDRFGAVTATRIPTSGYLPTATMLPRVTGFPAPPGAPLDGVGALLSIASSQIETGFAESILISALNGAVGLELESYARARTAAGEASPWVEMPGVLGSYQRAREGLLVAEQWPGTDAAAHLFQAQKVMPRMIGEAIASTDAAPWIRGISSTTRPPDPGGLELPPSGSPQGRPAPASPPAAPAPASSAGGGVFVLLASFGLGLVALAKKR